MRPDKTGCGSIPLFSAKIEVWCNGSTGDFGSPSLGSNPDTSTNIWVYLHSLIQTLKSNWCMQVRILSPVPIGLHNLSEGVLGRAIL